MPEENNDTNGTNLPEPAEAAAPSQELPTALTEKDRFTLEIGKTNRALGLSKAEASELAYNNLILQLTIKYKLTAKDSIQEDGTIVRG